MTVIGAAQPQHVWSAWASCSRPFGGEVRAFTEPADGRARQVRAQHLQRHEDQLLERDVAGRAGARHRRRPDRGDRRALGRGRRINPLYGIRGGAPYGGVVPAQGHQGLPRLRRARSASTMPLLRAVVEVNDRLEALTGQELRTRSVERECPAPTWHDTARCTTTCWAPLGCSVGPLGLLVDPAGSGGAVPADRQRLPVVDDRRGAGVPGGPGGLRRGHRVVAAQRVHEVILRDRRHGRPRARRSRAVIRSTVLVTDVPGKRDALRRGWNAARPIWWRWSTRTRSGPTTWPSRGVQAVRRPAHRRGRAPGRTCTTRKGSCARITDMFLDYRYFDENAARACSAGRCPACPAAPRCTGGSCCWRSSTSSCTRRSGACRACPVTTSGSPRWCWSAAT